MMLEHDLPDQRRKLPHLIHQHFAHQRMRRNVPPFTGLQIMVATQVRRIDVQLADIVQQSTNRQILQAFTLQPQLNTQHQRHQSTFDAMAQLIFSRAIQHGQHHAHRVIQRQAVEYCQCLRAMIAKTQHRLQFGIPPQNLLRQRPQLRQADRIGYRQRAFQRLFQFVLDQTILHLTRNRCPLRQQLHAIGGIDIIAGLDTAMLSHINHTLQIKRIYRIQLTILHFP